jgi:hypothetical protein
LRAGDDIALFPLFTYADNIPPFVTVEGLLMLKSYFGSLEEVVTFFNRLKLLTCPHCKGIGFLIRHGFLYGNAEDQGTGSIERGCRVFCSNRNKRKGCGRTFSILYSAFIKNCTVTAKTVSRFLSNIASGMNRLRAFTQTGSSFVSSSCYRIFNRIKLAQSCLRTLLMSALPPPEVAGVLDPVVQTVLHLNSVFPLSSCPVSAFQSRFQRSFI